MTNDVLLIRDYRGRLIAEPILEHTPDAWGSVTNGYGGRVVKAERIDSIEFPPDDPPPVQREDVNAYQRWRRRQQVRTKQAMHAGFSEHQLILPTT